MVVAVGYGIFTYYYYQFHQQLLGYRPLTGPVDPHYRLRMAGGAAYVVGFVLAGIGFWIASSAVRTAAHEPVEPSVVVP